MNADSLVASVRRWYAQWSIVLTQSQFGNGDGGKTAMKTMVMSVAASALLVAGSAGALDQSMQRYAQMLASGGVSSVQRGAEEIFNQSITDEELLDVAAEVLAQNYNKNPGETFVDSMAWVCRALGNSGSGRYKALLEDVADKADARKIGKYCKKGAGNLPKGVAPYVVGSTNLDKYKSGGAAGSAPAKSAKSAKSGKTAPAAAASSGNADFSKIREGMTMEEVESLIGPPTAMNSRITGKAFRPFNFSGKDSVRSYALYKGVGRLVLSNSSAYTSTYRVIEIVSDPTETGFP